MINVLIVAIYIAIFVLVMQIIRLTYEINELEELKEHLGINDALDADEILTYEEYQERKQQWEHMA